MGRTRRTGSRSEKELAKLLGTRLRELRHEHGWDQADLEAHLDEAVKRATLSDFETGRCLPSLRTLQKIAQAFNEEPATLLLDPASNFKHKIAIAVLKAPEDTLIHVAKLLDLE